MGAYLVRGWRKVTDCNTEVTPLDTRMRRIWHKRGQCTIQHECPNPMTVTEFGTRMILVGPLVRRSQRDTAPRFFTTLSQSRPMKEYPAGPLNAGRTPIRQSTSKMNILTNHVLTINPHLVVRVLQNYNRKRRSRGPKIIPILKDLRKRTKILMCFPLYHALSAHSPQVII